MIDREQVLHVARLARLELSEQEVERMAHELSAVLGHIEKIGELDLDGVPPTSHVVDVENALRADVPRPSLPRDVALESAPCRRRRLRRPESGEAGLGGVRPLPGAALIAPDGRAGRGRRRAGEIDAAELFEAYRARAARRAT